jgi:hypothetical protein
VSDGTTTPGACLLIGLLAIATPAGAAELRPETLRGFKQYVQQTEERIHSEVQNIKAFLWVDGLPATRREQALERLRRGDVVIERLETRPAERAIATPGAMIHHWMGTVLIPGSTLAQVLHTIQDYDCHREYFSPEVVRSRTLQHDGNDFTIYLRLQRRKVVTAVFDTEHQVRYHRLDASHAYSESRSMRIAELDHAGEAAERALPPGDDHGFLWRLNSYWRFVETPEGVYVQCEAVSLTRDIPMGLGWLVGPFIESIPKESLNFTLRSTRAAVSRGEAAVCKEERTWQPM